MHPAGFDAIKTGHRLAGAAAAGAVSEGARAGHRLAGAAAAGAVSEGARAPTACV